MENKRPIKICIAGGGPVGLIVALTLQDHVKRFGVNYQIHLYEKRWKITGLREVTWKNCQDGNNRRGQVVTLQPDVWSRLPVYAQDILFAEDAEGKPIHFKEMWPKSSSDQYAYPRNIPIRAVEDVLLQVVKEQGTAIELHEHILDESELRSIRPNAVVMADGGARSTERTLYPGAFGELQPFSEHLQDLTETVLGIYVEAPDGDAIGLSEADSMAITISQNRFLLNPLGRKKGFLNMWLTEDEARAAMGVQVENRGAVKQVKCVQGKPCTTIRRGESPSSQTQKSLFLPSIAERSGMLPNELALWRQIETGCKLYGIKMDNVKDFTVFQLGPYKKRGEFVACVPDRLDQHGRMIPQHHSFVVGDAAFQVNFRAGRGLNSGIKGALSLARSLTNTAIKKTSWSSWDFSDYNRYMSCLQDREVRIRSLEMMLTPSTGPQPRQPVTRSFREALNGESDFNHLRREFLTRVMKNATRSFKEERIPLCIDPPSKKQLKAAIRKLDEASLRIFVGGGGWNLRDAYLDPKTEPVLVPEPSLPTESCAPQVQKLSSAFDLTSIGTSDTSPIYDSQDTQVSEAVIPEQQSAPTRPDKLSCKVRGQKWFSLRRKNHRKQHF